jgi:hypothetical protein
MSNPISHMIGIFCRGVLDDPADMEDMRTRIRKIAEEMRDSPNFPIATDPTCCTSGELKGNKGSLVVLAGVFNDWQFEQAHEFACKLSVEFETEVALTTWSDDLDIHSVRFDDGEVESECSG